MALRRLRIGGHLTTVRDEGAGETCVLVHGSPLDHHSWDALVPLLSRDRRVIGYDLRGHGSAAAAPPAAAVEDFADDLAELLDGLEVAQAHLIGHSFGGQVVQCFAARFPLRTRHMTLLCTRATPYPPFDEAAQELERTGLAQPASVVARWFPPEAIAADVPAVRYARSCITQANPTVWASVLRMIAAFDCLEELRRLPMPASVVGAEHDRVASPTAMREMADALPRGRFHLLQDSFHFAPLLQPERIAALIVHGWR
ncbi:alpha/beta fold hydrolase [Streptomyces sp. NPDC008343]|uniref:alpha/beta fold hydrolase n=1 Tax=Streptomyces sp. NPDC008343 TaxID=3364828 RepID=UPI0036E48B0A